MPSLTRGPRLGCQLALQQTAGRLLDHLVGAGEQQGWHFEAEGFSRLQVDDELEPDRLDDRQVGGFGTLSKLNSAIFKIGGAAKLPHIANGAYLAPTSLASIQLEPQSVVRLREQEHCILIRPPRPRH